MPLDDQVRKLLMKKISEQLPLILQSIKKDTYDNKRWKYEHDFEFRYGELIGFLNGYFSAGINLIYGNAQDPDVINDIREIIETHGEEIRNYIKYCPDFFY